MHQLLRICLLIIFLSIEIPNGLAQEETIDPEPVRPKYLSQEYHALVVGVSNYVSWPVLPNAVQDAREISRLLTYNGFTVKLLMDPTSLELKGALNDLVYTTGQVEDRSLLVYFAGHGETRIMADGNAQGWIVPIDCPLMRIDAQGFQKNAVSTRTLEKISLQIRSRQVLMLFDCSFSGEAFAIANPLIKFVGKRSANPIRQYIIAGREDEPVPDRSMFKKYLIRGLLGDANVIYDDYITGSELGHFLSHKVERSTKGSQHPQYAKSRKPEFATGDFIMMKLKAIPKPTKAHLYVDAQPRTSRVRILNIVPTFRQGIALEPGKYHIEVSAKTYQTSKQWITVSAGQEKRLKVVLKKDAGIDTNFLGMRFVRIRPGEFLMGSPVGEPGRSTDETRHMVRLTRPFFVQQTEVTVGQFKQFVASTGYRSETEKVGGCWISLSGSGWRRKPGTNWRKPGVSDNADNLPVRCITWNDAVAFARWLSKKDGQSYRLPTEAEWEYVCRAGTVKPFFTGRCLSTDKANFGKTGHDYQMCVTVFRENRNRAVEVGTLTPNPWKLNNIHGNVSEWCQDWYGLYSSDHTTNPQGPSSGSERVMRGGHWQAEATGCRSAKRGRFPPNMASDVLGVRLVRMP